MLQKKNYELFIQLILNNLYLFKLINRIKVIVKAMNKKPK